VSYKEKLRVVVEETDTKSGRIFDLLSQTLILYSLICLSIETLPDLPSRLEHFLLINEWVVVFIFTIEYLTRVYVTKNKKQFVLSFYGVIDFIAIFPCYLGLSTDFRSIRALRFIRLIRLFKLARYSKSLERYQRALNGIKIDLVVFSGVTFILLYLSSVGIYHFEHTAQPEVFRSVFDAMWWAVATLTTVGYGDIYPITSGGRVFTFFILMIGLGIVAVPTGLIAAALTEAREEP